MLVPSHYERELTFIWDHHQTSKTIKTEYTSVKQDTDPVSLRKKNLIYENISTLTSAHNIASGYEHIDCIYKFDEHIFVWPHAYFTEIKCDLFVAS